LGLGTYKARINHVIANGEAVYYRYTPAAPPESKTLKEPTSGVEVLYPDGSIVAGAVLQVDHLRDESWFEIAADGLKWVVFYDINLVKDGQNIQPSGSVTVRIPFTSQGKVYHITADGQKIDMNAKLENGYLVFTVDHFSVYAVAVNEQISADKQFFKLWGKVTKWEKTFKNWILLIICFGWIWMAF